MLEQKSQLSSLGLKKPLSRIDFCKLFIFVILYFTRSNNPFSFPTHTVKVNSESNSLGYTELNLSFRDSSSMVRAGSGIDGSGSVRVSDNVASTSSSTGTTTDTTEKAGSEDLEHVSSDSMTDELLKIAEDQLRDKQTKDIEMMKKSRKKVSIDSSELRWNLDYSLPSSLLEDQADVQNEATAFKSANDENMSQALETMRDDALKFMLENMVQALTRGVYKVSY